MRPAKRKRRRNVVMGLALLAAAAALALGPRFWTRKNGAVAANGSGNATNVIQNVLGTGAQPYTDEALYQAIVEMARTRTEKQEFLYSGAVSAAQVGEVLNSVYAAEGTVLYTARQISYQVQPLVWTTQVTLQFTLRENTQPVDTIVSANTELAFVNEIVNEAEAGGETIVLRTDTGWFGARAVGLIGNALANAFTSSEVDSYATTLYPQSGAHQILEIQLTFGADAGTRAQLQKEMRQTVEAVAAEIRARNLESAVEQYRAAHDVIAALGSYDYAGCDAGDSELSAQTRISRSAYGLLVRGTSVCSGYAYAYKELCDQLSLPCWVMTGVYEGVDHAWNLIELEGQTYLVDCTFDDTSFSPYAYFMVPENSELYALYERDENTLIPWQQGI